jgi:hypothetical protein
MHHGLLMHAGVQTAVYLLFSFSEQAPYWGLKPSFLPTDLFFEQILRYSLLWNH